MQTCGSPAFSANTLTETGWGRRGDNRGCCFGFAEVLETNSSSTPRGAPLHCETVPIGMFGIDAYGDRLGPAGRQPVLLLRLRGGLGNQLFQYAAGRALALRNGVPLRLDCTSCFRTDLYGRSYALGGFNVLDGGTEPVFSADLGIRAALLSEFVNRRHD